MSERSPNLNRNNSGNIILSRYFELGTFPNLDDCLASQAIDTYKSLKNLKDMVKRGNISQEEYEVLKLELLIR